MGEDGFTPGRDRPGTASWPISSDMDSAVESTAADTRARDHLLRDCLALGRPRRRRAAKLRLEEALGPELTQKLLKTLGAAERT